MYTSSPTVKSIVIALLFLGITHCAMTQIPVKPNAYDQDSLRTGEWVVLFDSVAEGESADRATAYTYCLVNYRKGKPAGITECFYVDGTKQYEAWLTSIDPVIRHGFNTEYHQNGLVKIKASYEHNKLQGAYSSYYDNGLLSATGVLENDLQVGDWEFYHPNGNPIYASEYSGGMMNDTVVFFSENGQKESEGFVKDNNYEGVWRTYYITGELASICEYQAGKFNGICTEYHPNGALKDKGTYVNGLAEGLHQGYFDNGQLRYSGTYLENSKNGFFRFYFENGQLDSEGMYETGQSTGFFKNYYANGNLKSQGVYKDDQKQGHWRYYDEQGRLNSEGYLENGLWEGWGIFYNVEQGTYSSMGTYKNDLRDGCWEVYHTNGDIAGIRYYQEDVRHGSYRDYFQSGEIEIEGEMLNGNMDGAWRFYHTDGSQKSLEEYQNGQLHGRSIGYAETTGMITQIGQYEQGEKTGAWKWYFPDGTIEDSGDYHNGQKHGYWEYRKEPNRLSSKGYYEDGKTTGAWEYYHPNGVVKSKGTKRNGFSHGFWVYTDTSGTKTETGNWGNGLQHGLWNYYDDQGQLESQTTWHYDKPLNASTYYDSATSLARAGNRKEAFAIAKKAKKMYFDREEEEGLFKTNYYTLYSQVHENLGEHKKAMKFARNALANSRKHKPDTSSWVYDNILRTARLLKKNDEYEDAKEQYLHGLDVISELPNGYSTPDFGYFSYGYFSVLEEQGRTNQAVAFYDSLISSQQSSEASPTSVAKNQVTLINLLLEREQDALALERIDLLLAYLDQYELYDTYAYPVALYEKGRMIDDSDYALYQDYMQASATAFEATGDTHFNAYFEALSKIGDGHYAAGRFDSALHYFEQVLDHLNQKEMYDSYLYPKAHVMIGQAFLNLNRSDECLAMTQKGLDLYRKNEYPNIYIIAKAHSVMASAYEGIGQPDKAEKSYLESIKVLEHLDTYSPTLANNYYLLSTFYYDEKDYAKTLEGLTEVENYLALHDYPDEVMYRRLFRTKGDVSYSQGNTDDAYQFYEKSLQASIPEMPYSLKSLVASLHGQADVLESRGDYAGAQALNLQAADSIEKYNGKNQYSYTLAIHEIAYNFRLQDNYPTAIRYFIIKMNLLEEIEGSGSVAHLNAQRFLAETYTLNDQPDKALELLEVAEQALLQKESYQISDLLSIKEAQADAYEHSQIKDLARAEELQLDIYESNIQHYGKTSLPAANAADGLGAFYSRNREYKKSLQYRQNAVALIAQHTGKGLKYARVLNNLSYANYQLDNISQAINQREEALKIIKTQKANHEDYMNGLYLLTDFYREAGDYESANATLDEVADIVLRKFGKYSYPMSSVYEKRATVFLRWNKLDEALGSLSQLKSLYDSLGEDQKAYLAYHNLSGRVYMEQKNLAKSQPHFVKALDIAKMIWPDNSYNWAPNESNLGYCYMLAGDYENAEQLMLSHQAYFLDQSPLDQVKWLDNLATLYTEWSKMDKAQEYWDKTLSILYDKIEKEFPFFSDEGKTMFWDTYRKDFTYFNNFAVKANSQGNATVLRQMYDNQLRTKSLLLSNSTRERERILASGDSTLLSLYSEYIAIKERLAKYYGYTSDQLKAQGVDLETIQRRSQSLEKLLSMDANLIDQEQNDRQIRWKNVQRSLAEGEAAVEIIRYHHYDGLESDSVLYAVLIVTSETRKQPELVLLRDGSELEGKWLKAYLSSVKYKIEDTRSYEPFWAPIEQKLKGVSKIYLSVDGVYNQISLNTIQFPDKTYLMDHYDVSLVSSTRSVPSLKAAQRDDRLANLGYIFGYPKYDLKHGEIERGLQSQPDSTSVDRATNRATNLERYSFAELPGTKVETEGISDLLSDQSWETRLYLQENALEDQLKQVENPRLLHIATHGFFLEKTDRSAGLQLGINAAMSARNPLLRSGLLMTGATQSAKGEHTGAVENGIFTAYEAMNLNLSDTELVVLSACETGKGELKSGEGVYGLQRAFQVAGADAVVMSLWKVDDQATQQLMTQFYESWLSGQSKSDALKLAQAKVREDYPHPYYWGAFVMVE